jgi:hypothetical protein
VPVKPNAMVRKRSKIFSKMPEMFRLVESFLLLARILNAQNSQKMRFSRFNLAK